ncbi:hypothetical protein V9T40_003252 [Parthenolecanium corni]|uniref:EF-hand domain-containing protein n=1 Tax=Parthenolecanium corni TaxID=536013 RepID=A0AAN9TSE2_9HEMI
MVTSVWILSEAYKGPHHPPGSRSYHRDHDHPKMGKNTKIIHDTEILHDRRHLAEDLELSEFYSEEDLSAFEMDFRFFRLHDFDKNMKLDGTELYHAMLHQLEKSAIHLSEEEDKRSKEKEDEEENLARLIDAALEECDVNNDGYLSYSEFKAGRARAYARNDGSDEI